jgi:glutathione S-transferase
MFAEYHATLGATTFLMIMVIVQALIATGAHRSQKNVIPGVVDESLGHDSFVFRSHRTFMNSLENVPIALLSLVVAMMMGVSANLLSWGAWVLFGGRLMHMVLYYAIATEKNPSPRSYFYMIALLAQLYILGLMVMAWF